MAFKEEWQKEKKKLSRMTLGKKLEYLFEYYKLWIFGTLLVIGLAVSIISTVVSHKPSAFYAMMLNAGSGNGSVNPEELAKTFGTIAEIDLSQYDVTIDASESYDPNAHSEFTMAMTARISGLFAAHGLDVMVEDPTVFYYYVANGAYLDLRKVYTEEELKAFGDKLYYVDEAEIERVNQQTDQALASGDVPETLKDGNGTAGESEETSDSLEQYAAGALGTPTLISREEFKAPDPSTMEKPVPVGLILSESPKLASWGYYQNTVPILGFPAGSEHLKEAKQYADWLWEK